MKHVVTIHGINTAGEWQEQLKGVLEPHFSCVNIKYPHYRRFGALKLLFEPWVLLGGLFLFAVLHAVHSIPPGWKIWSILVLGLLFVSHLSTVFRRTAAIRYVKAEIDRHRLPGERPHVVAHSFGTFLVGALMKRFPDLRFEAIILAGCTLPTKFDWSEFKQNRDPMSRVRNEVAASDWALRLTSMFRRFIFGMGDAGVRGFLTRGAHTLPTPNARCSKCNGRSGLHNVRVPFGHSDPFVGTGHAETFWLPFLWNIDCAEYSRFLETCTLASDLARTLDLQRLAIVERKLLETRWDWADGDTLPSLIEKQLRVHFNYPPDKPMTRAMNDLVYRVVANLWEIVADVAVLRRKESKESGENLSVLFPRIAVSKAVASITSVTVTRTTKRGPEAKT